MTYDVGSTEFSKERKHLKAMKPLMKTFRSLIMVH